MKKVALLLALAGIVGAAKAGVMDDLAQFYLKQAGLDKLTAVIPPGHKVMLGEKAVLVSGSSICPVKALPDSNGIWVMGMDNESYAQEYAGNQGCVVIGPHTSKVSVDLFDKIDGRVEHRAEEWTVQHGLAQHVDTIVLKRPNGEFVADAR